MAYVYLIKNTITGQFYYGSRGANKCSANNDLWKSYFTSSKCVKELIKKFGKESFVTEVIFESDDFDKCYWIEQERISESINDELSLNQNFVDKLSGKKKFSTAGLKFGPLPDHQRSKISNSMTGVKKSETYAQNISKSLSGKKKSETTKLKMSDFQQSRPKVICEHCGKESNLLNYQKWHGIKCRAIATKEPILSRV